MKLSHAMTRRSFLQLLAGLAALGWFQPLRALRRMRAWSQPDPLAKHLTALFAHPASAAVVGRAYLRTAPMEADERRLVDLVCEGIPGGRAVVAAGDVGQLHNHIRQAQRRDFAQGRLARLDGWVLSQTEARLCALVALRQA